MVLLNDISQCIGQLVVLGCDQAIYSALREFAEGKLIGVYTPGDRRITAADLRDVPSIRVRQLIAWETYQQGFKTAFFNVRSAGEEVDRGEWMRSLVSTVLLTRPKDPTRQWERLFALYGSMKTATALIIGESERRAVERIILVHPDLTVEEAKAFVGVAFFKHWDKRRKGNT